MNLLLSIISGIYIVYMFNYFQTDIYLSHPFDIYTNNISFLKHSEKDNHICNLGNIVGYILSVWFIGRHFIPSHALQKNIIQKINNMILNIILLGCLLTNMNAFVYYLPLYIIQSKYI